MNDAAPAEGPPLPPFSLFRHGLVLSAVVAVTLAAAAAMLGGLGRWDLWPAALGGGLVCYVAALLALVPVARASRRAPHRVPMAALLGMGLRFAGSVVGLALLLLIAGLAPVPTAIATLGWYLLLLAVEVAMLVRYLRQWSPAES